MGIQAITDIRTVPVGEDLTKEELKLSIIRGLESMHRVDKPLAVGADFALGEWAVLKADGTLDRPTATPVPNTYLVFAGTDRFDVAATGQATIIMASEVIVKSSQFDSGASYAVGDALTVKNLGAGEAVVTKQSGTETILGRVLEVGTDYLIYQTLSA